MREYSKLSPQFWTGETGRTLRAAGKDTVIVAMYLVTGPHANMLGLYYLPKPFISHETSLSIEEASKALQRCIEAGFCAYDEGSECVFVYQMAAWQIGDELEAADKRCKGIQNQVELLPKTPLLKDFLEKYRDAFHLESPRGSEAPSKPGAGAGAGAGNKSPAKGQGTGVACPHQEIIDLYHAILPTLPKVRLWTEPRKKLLQSRWREDPERQTVAWWKKFFEYIANSDFLCGRSEPSPGRAVFMADLEWIVRPNNFTKIFEGKYENRGAA